MKDSVFKRTLMDVHFSTPYLILTIISGDELSLRYNMTQYRIEHDTMGEVKVPRKCIMGCPNRTQPQQLQNWTRRQYASGNHPCLWRFEKKCSPH